jgi:hypothetical protein
VEIIKAESQAKFDELTEDWRTLQVHTFGPLADFDDADEDDNIQVLIAMIDGKAAAYLIADDTDLWHIEVNDNYTGNHYGEKLARIANINYALEVCSDSGAKLCDKLGIEFDDCR